MPWRRSHDHCQREVSLPKGCHSEKFTNATKDDVLDNLLVIGHHEEKLLSKLWRVVCMKMQHNNVDNGQILHAVACFCKATEVGPDKSSVKNLPVKEVENNVKNVAVGGDENGV